jgi:hypothetical protein
VAPSFGLQGNSTTTSLTTNVTLPPTQPSLNGGVIPPSGISSLKLPHPPLSLAPHRHPTMQAPNTLKVEGSSSKNLVASTMNNHTVSQATAPRPFVTENIIKHVHNLLVMKQKVFLRMKECLKKIVAKKL